MLKSHSFYVVGQIFIKRKIIFIHNLHDLSNSMLRTCYLLFNYPYLYNKCNSISLIKVHSIADIKRCVFKVFITVVDCTD